MSLAFSSLRVYPELNAKCCINVCQVPAILASYAVFTTSVSLYLCELVDVNGMWIFHGQKCLHRFLWTCSTEFHWWRRGMHETRYWDVMIAVAFQKAIAPTNSRSKNVKRNLLELQYMKDRWYTFLGHLDNTSTTAATSQLGFHLQLQNKGDGQKICQSPSTWHSKGLSRSPTQALSM